MNEVNILDALNIVSVDVSSWSGGVTLRKEEIGIELPERAFSLGRKHLIAPEKLNPFTTIRRRAKDRCLKDGVKFLGGFALPADESILDALTSDLDLMRQEFEDKKAALLQDFSKSVDEWCEEEVVKPYAHLVRASLPSITSISKRISFDYSVFQVAPPQGASSELLEKEVRKLGSTLFSEISADANSLLDSFMERNKGESKDDWVFTSRMVGSVKGLRKKMNGLSVVDARISPIVQEIDRVLTIVPEGAKEGKHHGDVMRQMFSVLMILSNEDRMLSLGAGLSSIENTLGEFFLKKEEPQKDIFDIEANAEANAAAVLSSDHSNEGFDLELPTEFVLDAGIVMPVLDTSNVSIGF
jgi:hypothetical protein